MLTVNTMNVMKKILFILVLALLSGSAMAQSPEDKEAAKAAKQALKLATKEANKKLSDGLDCNDKVQALMQANQLEESKGGDANADAIAANNEQMLQLSSQGVGLITEALATDYIKDSKKFDAYKALDAMSNVVIGSEIVKASKKEEYNRDALFAAIFAQAEACHGELTYGKASDPTQELVIQSVRLKFPKVHAYFAYLCQFCIEAKDLPGAEKALDAYIHFPEKYPEIADNEIVKNPEYPASQFAFNIFFTAFGEKNMELMDKYYDLALQFDNKDSHNFVLRARPELFKEQGKTDEWIEAMNEVISKDPNGEVGEICMQQLMSYYSEKGEDAMDAYTASLVEKYPDNKIANYCRGFAFYAKKDFTQAITFFEKSVEIDPNYADGVYNCGYCHYQNALEKARAISGKKMKSQAEVTAAENEVKDYFRKAAPFFEKFREIAPSESGKWASPLHTIYKNIGEKEKAAEMEAYL